ncbi:MAG: hypothetical protein QGH75_11970, partial [Pseudomonadales bacterium]|nr:hypothetical protein [Pseudomonadales bacterium]
LRYLPWAIHGPRHLDHGSAIHGSTALRRRSINTPSHVSTNWTQVITGELGSLIRLMGKYSH